MIKLGLIVRRFKSRHFRRQCENTVQQLLVCIYYIAIQYLNREHLALYVSHKQTTIHEFMFVDLAYVSSLSKNIYHRMSN